MGDNRLDFKIYAAGDWRDEQTGIRIKRITPNEWMPYDREGAPMLSRPESTLKFAIKEVQVVVDREAQQAAAAPVVERPEARAAGMQAEIRAILATQTEVIARIDAVLAASPNDPALDDNAIELTDRIVRRAGYVALKQVLTALDGWIKGNIDNVEGGIGELEAVHRFHSQDIRNMVNDAARDLGVPLPWIGPTP
jgi:hypothetical protein